jgi:hypothetical protein
MLLLPGMKDPQLDESVIRWQLYQIDLEEERINQL